MNSTLVKLCQDPVAEKVWVDVMFNPHTLWFLLPVIFIFIWAFRGNNIVSGNYWALVSISFILFLVSFFMYSFTMVGGLN